MVPRDETRGHVRVQAGKEPAPPIAGISTSARFPGIRQQGRPPWSVSNNSGGAGRHLRTYNRDGRENSGGSQGGRRECQDRRKFKKKAPCEGRHIGVHIRNAGT